MVSVTDSLKKALLSSEQKDLILTFSDGTIITNDKISYESMEIEQTLCDEENLIFGCCASSQFRVQLLETKKQFKNLEFKAEISCNGETFSLGTYTVYTDDLTSDRAYKNIVAYDKLFWAFNTDVSAWYNNLVFPISQKDFRDSLFDFLGIAQEEVELINDGLMFEKTIDTTNLTGMTILESLCEINACFGHIGYDNKFRYFTFEPEYIFPSETLYPSTDLFPGGKLAGIDFAEEDYFLGDFAYEDFETEFITEVVIREDSEEMGVTVGKSGNTYVIENNVLLYGATVETLTDIANKFLNKVGIISYTPAKLSSKGRPWLEVGDIVSVNGMLIPILTRSMSGITALSDTFQARGTETYGENVNGIYNEIKQLQSKTARIVRTTDGLELEVASKVSEDEVVSAINLSEEVIELIGNRLVIKSDNFTLDEDGNAHIKGEINAYGDMNAYFDGTGDMHSVAGYYPIMRIDKSGIRFGLLDMEEYGNSSIGFSTYGFSIMSNGMRAIGMEYGLGSLVIHYQPSHFDSSVNFYGDIMVKGVQCPSGTFKTQDGKTVTVTNGLITKIS